MDRANPKRRCLYRDTVRQFIAGTLIVSVAWLAGGCDTLRESTMTGRFLDSGRVDRRLPAPKPEPRFFHDPARDDVLVTYDELREKDGMVRRRAFFFKANARRLEEGKKPKFTRARAVAGLTPVLATASGVTNAPAGAVVWVKLSPEDQAFTLVWHEAELGPYALPVYADGGSVFKRTVLTPLITLGDVVVVVVIVGLAAGVLFAYGYAQGHTGESPRVQ